MILQMINADRYCNLTRYSCSFFHINLQRGATMFVVEASSRQSPAYVRFFFSCDVTAVRTTIDRCRKDDLDL
jgi:hypothetical protein